MFPRSDQGPPTQACRRRGSWSGVLLGTVGVMGCWCWPASAQPRANPTPTPSNACLRPPLDSYEPDLRSSTGEEMSQATPALPAPTPPITKVAPKPKPTPPKVIVSPGLEPRLELSFGSAERFYNQDLYDPGGFVTRKAIPVSTIRPVVDWLFQPRASVWLAFDLALEPRTELKDDVMILTYVPPALQAGTRFTFVELNVLRDIWLDLQVDGGLGWAFSGSEDIHLFPHSGWRLHLRDNSGFTAYAGASYEFRLNVGALVYGVGHHF